MRRLTGKQRYWQAVRKARLASARELRRFMAGEIPSTTIPGIVREREAIIAELDRLHRQLETERSGFMAAEVAR